MAEKEIYRLQVVVEVEGVDETQKKLSNLDKVTERSEKRMEQLNKAEASPSVKLQDRLSAPLKKIESKLGRFSDASEKYGKKLTKGVSVPIVGMGAMATKSAIDFESAFAGVRKTVDATEAEFSMLETGIRDMAKEIPASAAAIAEVGEAAGQLGIETENILGFTRTMIDLGEATNMTSDEAATALARFANITGMSQTEFDKLGSSIVDLGNNLATTEGEIVAMGLRLAGAGSQIGMTEAEIMSFAGALSSVGIEAEAGGSAFSKVMIEMQLAVETGNESLKDFADVAGMTTSEFQKAFQEDAAGAIISFIQGLGSAEERGMSAIKVLDDMGISEVRLRDALLRASGASDVFTESLEMGSKAWEENTALTDEAAQRYETTASQFAIAKNYLTDAAITIGEVLVPKLVTLSEKAKDVASWFSNLSPETQETIIKLAGIAVAIGPVLSGAGKLAGGLKTVTGFFVKGKDGVSQFGKVMTFMTGPIGKAIIIIGLLVAAGVLLYKNWDKIKEKAAQLGSWISDKWNGIKESTSNAWENVKSTVSDKWNSLKDTVTGIGPAIKDGVTNTWDNIKNGTAQKWEDIKTSVSNGITGAKEIITNIIDGLPSHVTESFERMKNGVLNVFEGLRNIFSGYWEIIKNIFLGALLIIVDLVTLDFEGLKTDIAAIWENIKLGFSQVWEGIKQVFFGAGEYIKGYLTGVWQSLLNGIQIIWTTVTEFLATTWENIKTGAVEGWNSFKEAVVNVVTTTVAWIQEKWNAAVEWFSTLPSRLYEKGVEMFTKLREGIESLQESIRTKVEEIATSVIDGVKELPGKMLTFGKDIVQGLIDGITDKLGALKEKASEIAESVKSRIRGILRIESPSKVMVEYGEFTTEGLATGMEDRMPRLREVAGSTYNVITRDEARKDKVNRNPFKFRPSDDPNPRPRPQVAMAGGGQTVNIIQIDKVEVETGSVDGDTTDEELREIVDEAQEEFGRKLLEALRDKK